MPSVARVTVLASCEIGSARLKAKITSTMPISIVVGMLISVSTSHLHVRAGGSAGAGATAAAITLSSRSAPAEQYRCGWPVRVGDDGRRDAQARAPCQANRLISDRMRRCDSIANASSSSSAAQQVDELRVERERGHRVRLPAAGGPACRAPPAGTRCRGTRARGRCASWR